MTPDPPRSPVGERLEGAIERHVDRMLVATGLEGSRVIAGLTASNLLVFAVVLALPVLSVPAILRGGAERGLVNAALVGLTVFVLLFAAGVVLLSSERPLRWVGGSSCATCRSTGTS